MKNESGESNMAKGETKGESLNDKEVLTGELASLLGKTPQWIRQLTREGVLKQCRRGRYILRENIHLYIEHVQGGKDESGKLKYSDVKTEHELVKKEKAEMELRVLKGQLHEAKDVRAVMTDMILTVKAKLQSIPARVAPQLDQEPATTIEKTLDKEISGALRSLTDYSPELFRTKESDE